MAMDIQTASAIAALIIACAAFLIAFAQVLQQYFITGQLIRLCDSVVFGPLPGQGKRVWEARQWRFRVVYSMPQVSMDPSLFLNGGRHIGSQAIGEHRLPVLNTEKFTDDEDDQLSAFFSDVKSSISTSRAKPYKKHSSEKAGEGSWVSFCRAVEENCGNCMRYDLVQGDADRCPADLTTVPMLVSMREVILMGLMSGMEISYFSFTDRSLSMQGKTGSITSSLHQTLGPVLHFAPRKQRSTSLEWDFDGSTSSTQSRGRITGPWLGRTWDSCQVAGQYYNSIGRRTAMRLDGRWRKDNIGDETDGRGKSGTVRVRDDADLDQRQATFRRKKRNTLPQDEIKESSLIKDTSHRSTVQKYSQDGIWELAILLRSRTIIERDRREGKKPEEQVSEHRESSNARNNGITSNDNSTTERAGKAATPRSPINRQPTVEDGDEEQSAGEQSERAPAMSYVDSDQIFEPLAGADRIAAARSRQDARNKLYEQQQRDEELLEEIKARGINLPSSGPQPLLLKWTPSFHDAESSKSAADPKKPADKLGEETEKKAEEAQKRKEDRAKREAERRKRAGAHAQALGLGDMSTFWYSQINIMNGPWVTPWKTMEKMLLDTALSGATTVILEALLGYLDEDSLRYIHPVMSSGEALQQAIAWLSEEKKTYPAYALNARGGVIPNGTLIGVKVNGFKQHIPALELLYNYRYQTDSDTDRVYRLYNAELVRIDAWLSYVGRVPEIANGKANLLDTTPSLVEMVFEEFEIDFQNIDLSAEEGGLPDIQALAANMMDVLLDEKLSEGEQLYVLVALLRTVKVCQGIRNGQDTKQLEDVILRDIQAHMV